MNVVSEVVSRDLCISCRACEAACPHSIITFQFVDGLYHPFIDERQCTHCGLCTRVCPSYGQDLEFSTTDTLFVGNSLSSYTAHCKDDNGRENSSSGGVVTALIIKLLELGLYKKAAVVIYDKHEQQAEYVITDDAAEVMLAAKSKYVPVSTSKILDYIKDGVSEPLIVVATPCQIAAIKNYCKLQRINLEKLLFLGLFCEQSFNYNVYGYYGALYGDFDKMHFRSKYQRGWPGHTVLTRGDEHQIIDRRVRMSLKPYFKNNRCRHCFDKLNSQADISLGDCYVDGETVSAGYSSMIIRTERGVDAFSSAKDSFVVEESSFADIQRSQHTDRLINNYSRAKQCNPQMYRNLPDLAQVDLDRANEHQEYLNLRIGATVGSKSDYLKIEKMTRRKPFYVRLWNKLKKRVLHS